MNFRKIFSLFLVVLFANLLNAAPTRYDSTKIYLKHPVHTGEVTLWYRGGAVASISIYGSYSKVVGLFVSKAFYSCDNFEEVIPYLTVTGGATDSELEVEKFECETSDFETDWHS